MQHHVFHRTASPWTGNLFAHRMVNDFKLVALRDGADGQRHQQEDRKPKTFFHVFLTPAGCPFPCASIFVFPGSSVKKNVAPFSTSASAQIVPPCRRTMRATVASPTPVPSNCSGRCSRWNTPNNLFAYFMFKPTPLSRTKIAAAPSTVFCPTSMRAFSRGRVYLAALERRLMNTCLTSPASQLAE